MFAKTLVLIPCCNSKQPGGISEYDRSNCIVNCLSPVMAERLMVLRKQAGIAFEEEPGLDLGFENIEPRIDYLEAYKRYKGNLYSKISRSSWNKIKQSEELELIIVSALYGLVNWNEPIRNYNRTMDDHVHPRRRLNTWWSHKTLSSILLDFVIVNNIKTVHSFLSEKYAHAVQALSSNLKHNKVEYISHSYSRLGSGSNYHRGVDVNVLIQNFNMRTS